METLTRGMIQWGSGMWWNHKNGDIWTKMKREIKAEKDDGGKRGRNDDESDDIVMEIGDIYI